MGLKSRLLGSGYRVKEVRRVDRHGRKVGGFAVDVFDRISGGRFTSLPRGELALALYESLDDRVETLFGDSITAIDDGPGQVRVQFERAPARSFEMVVGADGLHSQVRRLVFGDASRFERYLGLKVAAFAVKGYRPRDELTYMIHSEIGQQIGRFSMRDDRTMFLFVFKDPDPKLPEHVADQKTLLRQRFSGAGWECQRILQLLADVDSLYFDQVSQVRMDAWTRGRVALVGDAASCVSLLAGQGAALAMVAGYVLAAELVRAGGDHTSAFERYQTSLAPYIRDKQHAAQKLLSFFAPRSHFGMFVGNQVMKLLGVPFIADLAIGRQMRESLELPSFESAP